MIYLLPHQSRNSKFKICKGNDHKFLETDNQAKVKIKFDLKDFYLVK